MEIYIQKVRENLKQRFKREYLGFLRSSVIKREDKINEDDIVLIGTDDKKRLHWLLGRVLELFPGKDGIIRLVKSRTESGDMLRPIQRLYPLEVTSNHGFLNGYFFCLEYSKKSGRISWLNFYRKRFLRIAPLHMMVYWTYTTLFTYTGSGPLWPTYDTNPVCRKYWWWDLLYINNFLTGWQQCLIVNWYLAVDMQLYMMSPLFVIALLRRPRLGYGLMTLLVCLAGCYNFITTYLYDLDDDLLSFPNYLDDTDLFISHSCSTKKACVLINPMNETIAPVNLIHFQKHAKICVL
ncbi:nose resistant to fluoxetine protein 6 [Trichonephila clavipes]|nr:nose resistant to fluoxetine protein 6 [Trichonephila clavipes]